MIWAVLKLFDQVVAKLPVNELPTVSITSTGLVPEKTPGMELPARLPKRNSNVLP